MLSVAVPLTGVILFNTFLSLIGHAAITSTLYSIVFTYILPNDLHKRQRTLKKDILDGRRELSNTSAQDDFAKWAKIRRRVDKQVAELDTMNGSLAAHKNQFATFTKVILFILTTGLQWYFTTRYSRNAIVYLPKDWFGPFTWFLSLPFAPKGALSCGVWAFLVKRILNVLTRIGADIYAGVRGDAIEAPVQVPATEGGDKAAPDATKKKQ